MLIIRNSARGGWKDGIISSFGICSGLFVHASISAIGISVILLNTAWLFRLIKFIGALYLIWLGISNWIEIRNKTTLRGSNHPQETGSDFNCVRSLREGFLSNILNPKTALFYMAFLPQFINPSKSALIQSLILAGIHFLIAMAWQCFLAVTIDRTKKLLQQPRIKFMFTGITGSVMILLGLKLATEN
jgi:threonine/homoserine/homoserine lactone efflux protein